jgi:hypothetical protein
MTPHEERPGSLVKWCGENGERGQRLLLEYRDDEKLPSEVMALSSYNALWRCAECEHEWKAGVCSRTRSDAAAECMRCRGCSARGISFRVWCDANGERGKSLLEEYVDTDRGPMDVTRASGYKALWKCATCEHEWRTKICNRTTANNPTGCPKCPGFVARSNKFQVWCDANGERGKKLLEEYVDTDRGPTDVTHGSKYKALWKCATCEHEWRAKMNNRMRANNPSGCPACSGYTATSTKNFQVWCEENGERGKKLLEEYVDTDRGPTDVTHGSSYKALWKCATCEHEWWATMNHHTRANNPAGCPSCSRYAARSTFRVWCDANGEIGKKLLEEYVDTDRGPMDVTRASAYKALWKCATCEHEWRAKVGSRTNSRRPCGCPKCANHMPLSKTNNFQAWCDANGERGKTLLEEYIDPDRGPTRVTNGSTYKALWKCATCEHEWRTTLNCRTLSGRPTGCPANCRKKRKRHSPATTC